MALPRTHDWHCGLILTPPNPCPRILRMCLRACGPSFARWFFMHTHPLGEEEGPKRKMRRYLARQQSSFAAALATSASAAAVSAGAGAGAGVGAGMSERARRAGFIHPRDVAVLEQRGLESSGAAAALHSTIAHEHKRLRGFARRVELGLLQPALLAWLRETRRLCLIYRVGDEHAVRGALRHWKAWGARSRRRAVTAQLAATVSLRPAASTGAAAPAPHPRLNLGDALGVHAARTALRAWVRFVSSRQRVRHWSAHNEVQRRECAARGVLRSWAALALQQRSLRALAAAHTRRITQGVWAAWTARMRWIARSWSLAVQTAEQSPAHASACFYSWYRRTIVARFQRAHQIKRALVVWRGLQRRRAERLQLEALAHAHRRAHEIPLALRRWKRATRRRGRRRAELDEADGRADALCLFHALATWREALRRLNRERAALAHYRAYSLTAHFRAFSR